MPEGLIIYLLVLTTIISISTYFIIKHTRLKKEEKFLINDEKDIKYIQQYFISALQEFKIKITEKDVLDIFINKKDKCLTIKLKEGKSLKIQFTIK